uniref:Taste receptor type 2 n=1 Tax=Leptobrachium leishanense TaxID=445787 RepID=A0A8C5M8S8_9ANUR
MGTHIGTFTLIFQLAFDLLGLVSNGYITFQGVKDLVKMRSLPPCEKLLSSLSFINLCLQLATTSSNLCYYFWPQVLNTEFVPKFFFGTGLFLVSTSLWISTWFSVFCSIKIVNKQQKPLMWLQKHMPVLVNWLIIGSVLIGMVQSLSEINDLYVRYRNITDNHGNFSVIPIGLQSRCFCTFWINLLIISEAFILFLIATLTILCSLWIHVKNMKRRSNILGNPKFGKLARAARTVSSLLFLCITFYLVQCLLYMNVAQYGTLLHTICMIFISMFPAMNAIILIIGNQNLKRPVDDFRNKLCCKCNKDI